MRNRNKDRYGHYVSTNHDRIVERKKNKASYKAHRPGYIDTHNSCIAYYSEPTNVDSAYQIMPYSLRGLGKTMIVDMVNAAYPNVTVPLVSHIEKIVTHEMREFHNEVCGCNRFRVKEISHETFESHETITLMGRKAAFTTTRRRYKLFVRCADHETFAVSLSLDPKWGEM